MKPANNLITERMTAIKASCDKAAFGEKKTAALKHYRAAEAAHKVKDDMKTNRELDAAKHALA